VSRAFVKEDDGNSEVQAPRLQRQHPYYVTREGYEQLQQRLAQAQASGSEREIEDLQERVEAAIVVDPLQHEGDDVAFGASVTVEEPDRKRCTYRIVGEDEANPAAGSISWLSPLAQALMQHRAGDRVIWQRPAGNLPLRIVDVTYAV
jgi:transcription elongation GreA/GreB family factor